MHKRIFIFFFLIASVPGVAQSVSEMPLYPGTVPGSKQSPLKEQVVFANGTVRISSVIIPTLTKYTPVKPNGSSVIICPGGGYGRLAIDHEGVEVAIH